MKMLSRVAESLFWMSRYLERAEDVARIIAVNFQASLDAPEVSQALAWEPVIAITGERQLYAAAFERYDEASVTAFLTRHPENRNAILSCVGRARENARAVREQISREMWEEINRLYHVVYGACGFDRAQPVRFLQPDSQWFAPVSGRHRRDNGT